MSGASHEQRAHDLLRDARNAHSEQVRADLKREARSEASKIDDPDHRDELLEAIRHV